MEEQLSAYKVVIVTGFHRDGLKHVVLLFKNLLLPEREGGNRPITRPLQLHRTTPHRINSTLYTYLLLAQLLRF